MSLKLYFTNKSSSVNNKNLKAFNLKLYNMSKHNVKYKKNML